MILGYNFTYPFLSVDCGIFVDENFVQPLYKQTFNIEHPTMVFIGIPFTVATTRLFDLQVNNFFFVINTNHMYLPHSIIVQR